MQRPSRSLKDAEPSKSSATVFSAKRPERSEEAAADQPAVDRKVVLYIKATDKYRDDKARMKDDRLTEIAAFEIINGKLTKNRFNEFVQLEDPALLQHCERRYREDEELSDGDKNELLENLAKAKPFAAIEKSFMDFAFAPGTVVVVHFKLRVLELLRAQLGDAAKAFLNENHKAMMREINSDLAILRHAGVYHAGQYQPKLDDKGKAAPAQGKTKWSLDELCNEFGVKTQRRTKFSAEYDGRRFALAYIECQKRIQALPKQNDAEVAAEPAAPKKRR